MWDYVVDEIQGNENGVNKLKLQSTKTKNMKEIPLSGVFVAIGHDPSTACFKNSLNLDEEGYIMIMEKGTTFTNIDGVFAAGDCVDKIYRQAVTAAGMGCMAALDAEKWLQTSSV